MEFVHAFLRRHYTAKPSVAPQNTSHLLMLAICQQFVTRADSWNSPYACLRQTSKFHHQVSFSKYKVAKFCINEFPGQYSWKEYPRIKSANAKNFAFKRGLVVKFARLTQSRIRAIQATLTEHLQCTWLDICRKSFCQNDNDLNITESKHWYIVWRASHLFSLIWLVWPSCNHLSTV